MAKVWIERHHVDGRITEERDGRILAVDFRKQRQRRMGRAIAESLLAEFDARWPRADHLDAVRYLIERETFSAAEFCGNGDPAFGGSADDRALGTNGRFLTGSYHRGEVALFPSREAAQAAAEAAPNKRAGATIGAMLDSGGDF